MTGSWPLPKPYEIDHENRIKYDNKWKNLREITHQKNIQNQVRPNRDNLPQHVYLSREGRFVVKFKINKRNKHVGQFLLLSEAIIAIQNYKIGLT